MISVTNAPADLALEEETSDLTDEIMNVVAVALRGPPDEKKVLDALAALAFVSSILILGTREINSLDFFRDIMRGLINKDELGSGKVH